MKRTCPNWGGLLGVLVVAIGAVAMSGCSVSQADTEFVVRQGSELATLITLVSVEAERDDAELVETIAATVVEALDGEDFDGEALKVALTARILAEVDDQNDRLIYLTLVNNLFELVKTQLARLSAMTPGERTAQVLALVRAAADGAASGSRLYIQTLPEQ